MNTDQTINELRKLRLTAMAECYQEYLKNAHQKEIDIHTFLAMLVEAQNESKKKRKIENLLKHSNLRFLAFPEDISPSEERGLTLNQWTLLCSGKFIDEAQNILFTGSTGSGKTFCSCALGYLACQKEFKVKFLKFTNFARSLALAEVEGNIQKLLDQYAQVKLLILNDWGLDCLSPKASLYLHHILDERYDRNPTIITSQYPIKEWYNFIKEPTLSESVLDRIVNNAININLKGKSRRAK